MRTVADVTNSDGNNNVMMVRRLGQIRMRPMVIKLTGIKPPYEITVVILRTD